MRCREFEDRMNDALDQRLPPERDALLLRHAGECRSCRQLLAGQATLLAGIELMETPPLSTSFATAVLVQSREIPVATEINTRQSGKKKWLRMLAGLVSLAAVVLVAVWIGMSRQQDPARPTAVKPAAPLAPKTIEVAKDSMPPKPSAPTLIAKAVAPPSIAPPVAAKEEYQEYRDAINSLTAQLPSAVEKIDEVQQSTPAIRPLRASFSMAIGTLQRTIPSRTKRDTRPIKPDSGFLYSHQRDLMV